jgi:signal transduction histidine kinase
LSAAVPWVARGFAFVDVVLIRAFLGSGSLSDRVRSLEQSRSRVVDDAAATLRRVERDLHDGAQARLISVAMSLGEAKDRLSRPDDELDLPGIRELVNAAHAGAKEAIVELREVVRTVHPPALDSGLGAALETLASRSTVPVTLEVSMASRPGVSVESIAYFCVAELLTNIAKHSGSKRASVIVNEREGVLYLVVADDGIGGADSAKGSGLEGLTQRVDAVDGRLVVDSPQGGPTLVRIELPLRS